MANEGAYLTTAVSLAGAVAFLIAARRTHPRRGEGGARRAISVWYVIAGAFLLAAGSRITLGHLGLENADRALFFIAGICAYGGIVPLAYIAFRLVAGRHDLALIVSAALAVVGGMGIYGMLSGGVVGPEETYWATEWRMQSALAKMVLLFGILVPALAFSISILAVGFRMEGADGLRLRWVGASILMYYVMVTSDGLALSGGILILERTAMALAGLAVVRAYVKYEPDA